MVKGIDVFQHYFCEYTDQYVLIGGAACSIFFEDQKIDFGRVTKDLDVVLIAEALTKEFVERFWQFIKEGKYRIRTKSDGKPGFYRFDKPENDDFPKMIELFSRTDCLLKEEKGLTPIHIDDSISSLSAILLDDAYYQVLMQRRKTVMGISVLTPEWIVPFKAKAWLDLRTKNADGADIRKHRNDIIRIVSETVLQKCLLPESIREDMTLFLDEFDVSETELKNMRIRGVKPEDIKRILKNAYLCDGE